MPEKGQEKGKERKTWEKIRVATGGALARKEEERFGENLIILSAEVT